MSIGINGTPDKNKKAKASNHTAPINKLDNALAVLDLFHMKMAKIIDMIGIAKIMERVRSEKNLTDSGMLAEMGAASAAVFAKRIIAPRPIESRTIKQRGDHNK